MLPISTGGPSGQRPNQEAKTMSEIKGNPFTPANDPLKDLYPNVSSGREAVSGEKNPYTQPQGIGAATKAASSAKDISYVYGDSGNWTGSGGSSGTSSAKSKKEEFDWKYADIAKHYGMSKETGYSEAMENTSYQRAVKDMQAAGLNPAVLFGNNAGDGSGTPGYIRSASSGGGGGGGGYSRSYGSARSRKLLSSNAYAGVVGAGTIIGGIIGGVASKSAFGVSAGATAGAAVAGSIAKIANALING